MTIDVRLWPRAGSAMAEPQFVMPTEIRALFMEEAAESLAGFEARLLELERTPTDRETVDVLFRLAHTLKGSSGMMGFTEIAHFMHGVESVLEQIRSRVRDATPEVIGALLASVDVL